MEVGKHKEGRSREEVEGQEQISQRQRQQQGDAAVCSDGPVLDDLLELRVQHAGFGDHHLSR